MAKRKSIKSTDMNLEKMKKQIAEMEAKRKEQINNAVLKMFGSIFQEEIVCNFYDEHQKNKGALTYIQDKVKETLFKIIEDIETGVLVFEESDKELTKEVEEEKEEISSEKELLEEE